MSTIRTIIERVDGNKPNAFPTASKVAWLAELDGKITADVFLMDVAEVRQFTYDPEKDLDTELLVRFPHDDIYYYWLSAKIDAENGEYNKYQNTMQLYNASYNNFVNWFLGAYEPMQGCGQFTRRRNVPSYYITAYGLAVKRGFVGTIDQWLASLVGKSAYDYAQAGGYTGSEEDFTQKMAETAVYYLTVSDNGNGGYKADWAFEDIRKKHRAGHAVYCKITVSREDSILGISGGGDAALCFAGAVSNGHVFVRYDAGGQITVTKEDLSPEVVLGNTSTVLPVGVFNMLRSGKTVILTHVDATYGTMAFTGFAYVEAFKAVFGSGITRHGDALQQMCLCGDIAEEAWTLTEVDTEAKVAALQTDVAKIKADLAYVPIDITSISCPQAKTYELGQVVETVIISWGLNKAPVKQVVDGQMVSPVARSTILTPEGGISAAKTYTLTVTDEREATDKAEVSLRFYNAVYFGVVEDGEQINSATIAGLGERLGWSLQSGRAMTFTATAGPTQRLAYALPTRYGTPTFSVGGFEGGFYKAATVEFTNASGYTENYDVWLSDELGLGTTTVKVS